MLRNAPVVSPSRPGRFRPLPYAPHVVIWIGGCVDVADVIAAVADVGERVKVADVDEDRRCREPELHQREERVTAREPNADELARLMASWSAYRDEFRRDTKASASLLAAGNARAAPVKDEAGAAALVAIASVLLNLDEVVTKE